MSIDHNVLAPAAGWYPDPSDSSRLRWWDGATWTEHARALALESPQEPEPQTQGEVDYEAAPLTRRELREQVGPLVSGITDERRPEADLRPVEAEPELAEGAVVSAPIQIATPVEPDEPYVPVVSGWSPEDPPHPHIAHGSSQTVAAWLMAVAPLWASAAAVTVATMLPSLSDAITYGSVGLVTVVLSLALALSDRAVLHGRGYERMASPVWAVIPVVYLVVRAIRVGKGGLVPLLAFLLFSAGVAAFILSPLFDTLVTVTTNWVAPS